MPTASAAIGATTTEERRRTPVVSPSLAMPPATNTAAPRERSPTSPTQDAPRGTATVFPRRTPASPPSVGPAGRGVLLTPPPTVGVDTCERLGQPLRYTGRSPTARRRDRPERGARADGPLGQRNGWYSTRQGASSRTPPSWLGQVDHHVPSGSRWRRAAPVSGNRGRSRSLYRLARVVCRPGERRPHPSSPVTATRDGSPEVSRDARMSTVTGTPCRARARREETPC